ncbi:MAG: hypothetical protein GY820_03955 [Gammaproteobacteria bacterium]|nr:hypothetical protein [Gammaproteobacteria bacterium]
MELKITEDYEELATEWQYQVIEILKNKLQSNGVSSEIAKEIVGEFIFDLSMLHDQEEIKVESKSYNPRICFYDFDGKLIATDEETNLHEYAFGSTSEAYGD